MKKIADNTLAILLGLIVAIMFAQVLFRYTFNNSLSWSEEIAKFIFIWITFLGAALCFRDRMHLGVDFLIEKIPGKYRILLIIFNTLLITLFNGFIIVIGFSWVINVSGTLSPALSLPLNIVFYAALPTSAVISFVYGLLRIKEEIKSINYNTTIRWYFY
jgi:C4-dicarboxylate transporter DctQ subunit